jgi:hypothetical protein
VHRIALSGTPGSAGPWNKISHPRQGRTGGSRPCLPENTTTSTSLLRNIINSKKQIQKLYKANSSKEKAKTELFPKDSVPELNTKKLGNFLVFLTITHKTLFAKQFRSYRILTIDVAAELCFWAEQRQIGPSISSPGLTKNSRSPEYLFSRKLSQLSDDLLNCSKRLVVRELWQSETRLVAESAFLGRLHLPV